MSPLLGQPLRIVNVGLELFASELETAGVPVLHVDWHPPIGGPEVAALLVRLADS